MAHVAVKKMKREQAVKVVKEIFDLCKSIEGKSIKLMPSNPNVVSSKGCQIHIQTRDDELLENCLKTVADSHGLAAIKEGDNVIIYKPQN
jgi:hypothetical protein